MTVTDYHSSCIYWVLYGNLLASHFKLVICSRCMVLMKATACLVCVCDCEVSGTHIGQFGS